MDKKHCQGCRDNYYNGTGAKECWLFKDAKMVWRIPVGFQEPPPYKGKKKRRVPHCWHGEGPHRTLYVSSDSLDSRGYWK